MSNNSADAEPLNLDLQLLVVFDTLYGERHLSRTAQRLGMAQPTVSHALNRLRQITGDPLFVRTGRGMEPTPHAQRMVQPLREALATLRATLQARRRFDAGLDRRTFTLFLTDLGEAYFLPRLLAHVRQAAPGVSLRTLPMPDRQPQAALESGEVDLAIGHLPDMKGGYYQQRLFRERYVCIVRADHPLFEGPADPARLREARHAVVMPHGTSHNGVEQALTRLGLQDHIVLRAQNFLVLPAIVRQTDLVALIPRSAASALSLDGGLRQVASPIELPDFVVKQCWHERLHADAGHQWLRQQIAALFGEGSAAGARTVD